MLSRSALTFLKAGLVVLMLSTGLALAQGAGGGNPGANNPGNNNPSNSNQGNQGATHSVPEINPAAAGAVAVIVAGGGVLLARRRRR